MQGIFISYRRLDSRSAAGRPADHLRDHLPHVPLFRDVETIEPALISSMPSIAPCNRCRFFAKPLMMRKQCRPSRAPAASSIVLAHLRSPNSMRVGAAMVRTGWKKRRKFPAAR